ncbi:MAG: hypothetical protein GQ574_11835 [Crocinitomix sp.]|nr:hypothetical protein [Crocinitomix sp.]
MPAGLKQNIKTNASYYLTMTIIGWTDVLVSGWKYNKIKINSFDSIFRFFLSSDA